MARRDGFYFDRPLVIAHRGARDVAPENTLAAFVAAIDAGSDGIELDVTRCATGEIVVIHDDTKAGPGSHPLPGMMTSREADGESLRRGQLSLG